MPQTIEIPLLAVCAALLVVARRKTWLGGWLAAGLATVTAATAFVVLAPGAFDSIHTERTVLLLAVGLPFAWGVGMALRQLPIGFGVCAALALMVSLSSPALGPTSVSIARYVVAAVPALMVLGSSAVER